MTINLRVAVTAALFVAGAAGSLHAQEPVTKSLSHVTRDLACAPASPMVKPAMPLVVAAGREARKTLFGTGDAVVIRGGTAQGVRPGDEYFVRRVVPDKFTEAAPGVFLISVHAAGFLQIVEAQADASIGVITYGCDGVMEGDYLEKYVQPVTPAGLVGTTPDYSRPAKLILGDERRQVHGAGQFMVLDRGSDHGLRPGQQLTIFRQTLAGGGPVATIGTATVYTVQPETSVVRIEKSIDAVYVGDLVAIHR